MSKAWNYFKESTLSGKVSNRGYQNVIEEIFRLKRKLDQSLYEREHKYSTFRKRFFLREAELSCYKKTKRRGIPYEILVYLIFF